jgi:GNAT superfamily N-acetyltransferase
MVPGNPRLRLKLWARSYFIMALRWRLREIGIKNVKAIIYKRDLGGEIPVEIKLVSASDVINGRYSLGSIATGDDPVHHGVVLSRFNDGQACLAAMVADKVVGYCWMYPEKRYLELIEREEHFADGGQIGDGLVLPKYRGQGIYERLVEETLHFMKLKGFSKAYVYPEADNIRVTQALEALGFSPVKSIACLRVFRFMRVRECFLSKAATHEQINANEG